MGRYAKLVDTAEARVTFRAQYRIPNNVEIRHCEEGEWLVLDRSFESVVISMIAFIEGGMELPMGRETQDYLMNYRLTPTQCSANIFRILRWVDALNRRMGTNLTWHNVNWVYKCQKGEKTEYYMKCRVPVVKLISYLLNSSKGMDKDFLLILGGWHDGIHCPTKEGEPGITPKDQGYT